MPKYVFICEKCKIKSAKYVPVDVTELDCDKCNDGLMLRQLPIINGSHVKETVDTAIGVTWHQDQKEKLQDRKEDHFWSIEVPRLVEKYSLETCLENKWLVYNEKGELVIGKAPSKH